MLNRLKDTDLTKSVQKTTNQLLDYCNEKKWAGYDPYDSLNSRIFKITPFNENRICRIIFIQLLKRLPINLRKPLLIPERQNAKALGLFLSAVIKLRRSGMLEDDTLIRDLINYIIALRSNGHKHWCWGYSFPWQTRTNLVPDGTPNLVCTTFVMHALLDAYEYLNDPALLDMATSAADYLAEELFWEEADGTASFSYPLPGLRSKVHNANFLGAAALARVHRYTPDEKYILPAYKVTRFSAAKQEKNGAWIYGERHYQGWADNFHTGFNLCALQTYTRYSGSDEFLENITLGFKYYVENFFENNVIPKYYDKQTYPIDIHSVAQSIITLVELKHLDERSIHIARNVYKWAVGHMLSPRGYFYYQVATYGKNKIPYMRWSQAWMLLALATLLEPMTVENSDT